ncbi:HAMP domain-containing sensor histidine kinase [Flavobacterium paronense]|uniref:histidine kinase n=1 Tax=Flavobacterium paronense TaxID=1392775 RepID=A0ABV5GDM3_9FLAO|nr:HAMP domain-containing sensor histidine kinase [Flavobacterium paronense]MDN3678043.1 HAMP domain-containing sensor histidine kinase [Flavobacterium paronense]
MKRKNNAYLILFITLTIVATIGLQVYWNIKNYKENKARLINEVQIALDNSIEYYYVEDVKNDFVAYVNNNKSIKSDDFFKSLEKDSIFKKQFNKTKKKCIQKDSIKTSTIIQYKVSSTDKKSSFNQKASLDSIRKQIALFNKTDTLHTKSKIHIATPKVSLSKINPEKITSLTVFTGKKAVDSISKIKDLANRIIISMVRDSIDFKKLNAHLKKELTRKNINILYAFNQYKSDSLFDTFGLQKKAELPLKTISKSTYLPSGQKLELAFSNPMLTIVKRSMTEILLSLLLSLSIISCLLYLLRTINRQKKIDEIKNDLISNITHEFKTPITTISTAIEGIKSFNAENDVEKTNRYLAISGNQLKKLEVMVERLLETASLETDQLMLKKEKTDLLPILTSCIEKQQINVPEKTILFESDYPEVFVAIDSFHIENAISNLIDNAVKYGGNHIKVRLTSDKKSISILIEDNGIGIDKSLREKIFEKFYRIPKGNIHDVKGFGIGLYYSKKIIEKHGGSIELLSNAAPTIFKITLPNEY